MDMNNIVRTWCKNFKNLLRLVGLDYTVHLKALADYICFLARRLTVSQPHVLLPVPKLVVMCCQAQVII